MLQMRSAPKLSLPSPRPERDRVQFRILSTLRARSRGLLRPATVFWGQLLIFLFLLSGEGRRKDEGKNGKIGTITSAAENNFPTSKFAQYQDQRTRREKSAIC
jgi:hypothetical protein